MAGELILRTNKVVNPTNAVAYADVNLQIDDTGSVYTNLSCSAETEFILPYGCPVGLKFTFVVVVAQTGRMTIRPDYAADHLSTIRLETALGEYNNVDSLQSTASASEIGDSVTVVCVNSTALLEEFIVISMVGSGWSVSPFS